MTARNNASQQRSVLRIRARDAAYSAKGHFKTADALRLAVVVFIFIPLATSLATLALDMSRPLERWLSFIGALFSGLALSSALSNDPAKAEGKVRKHMELGNKYLALYKEIRDAFHTGAVVEEAKLLGWASQGSCFDAETSKLRINLVGRWWARLRAVKELDAQWMYETD